MISWDRPNVFYFTTVKFIPGYLSVHDNVFIFEQFSFFIKTNWTGNCRNKQ